MSSLRPRSLAEYAGVLWRRKLLIILTAAVMLAATLLVIKRLPNIYESRALIAIAGTHHEDGRQAAAAEVSFVTQQLQSRALLVPLIERHGLYPGLSNDAQIAQLIKSFELETRQRNFHPPSPESVVVRFRHSDAAVAKRVLDDVVALFARTNEGVSQQAAEEVRAIGSKIAVIEGQLRQNGARRSVRGPAYDYGAIRAERRTAAASVETLKDRQYVLERQIAEQQRQIAEQQQLVKTAPPSNQSGAAGALLVRKAELEAQLKDYATQYTEKNPKVVLARQQLAEVNNQLAQLNASNGEQVVTNSGEARELRALERELARLRTEYEVTQRELTRRQQTVSTLPEVGWSTAPMVASEPSDAAGGGTAEIGYLQSRYVALLDKHDRMQLALAAPTERGLTPFRLIDPPNLPQLPVGPNRDKLKMIALALAVIFGLGAAVAVEGPRLRLIQNRRDAEYYLGAPVVALIPETLTPVERGHQRRLQLTRKVALIMAALLSVPVLALLLYYLGIIQQIASR